MHCAAARVLSRAAASLEQRLCEAMKLEERVTAALLEDAPRFLDEAQVAHL